MKFTRLLPLLLGTLGPALAATSQKDTDAAANAAALVVDGLITPCPASVRQASSAARCVASELDLAATRKALSSAKSLKLYGAWHTDGQGRVYNWVVMPSGYVNIGVLTDSTDAKTSTIILTPSSQAAAKQSTGEQSSGTQNAGSQSSTQPSAQTPAKAPAQPAAKPAAVGKIPPFKRVIRLTNPRMNGADVRQLQLRLMAVSKVDPGKGGDGWFGPVTEANVIVFQIANGLKPTGVVDAQTWTVLFSDSARYFDASAAQELAKRRR